MLSRIIIVINIAVYLLWSFADEPRLEYMYKNFLVSWDALSEGRYWTLLTSAFSHNMLIHILLNMFVLSSFGPVIEKVLGSWRFLKFYLVAGIMGSLSHA